jgi:alkanesulfonate monooxygenase SsuD/methylene tetrahydromethanopterin reductase-like flavin-dependent oxidoreductase (luciferase family)
MPIEQPRTLRIVAETGGTPGVYELALDPGSSSLRTAIRVAGLAEAAGFDLLFVPDLLRFGARGAIGAREPLLYVAALSQVTQHIGLKAVAYALDIRARLAKFGRAPDSVRILPGASVVLGDTPEDARERAEWVRRERMNGPRALAFFEQYWGTDLSGYDPEGPLPDIEPSTAELDPSRGTVSIERRTGKLELIAKWRDMAEEGHLSMRQLAQQVAPSHTALPC